MIFFLKKIYLLIENHATIYPFEVVAGHDTMKTKNNTFVTIKTKFYNISAMSVYQNESMEVAFLKITILQCINLIFSKGTTLRGLQGASEVPSYDSHDVITFRVSEW